MRVVNVISGADDVLEGRIRAIRCSISIRADNAIMIKGARGQAADGRAYIRVGSARDRALRGCDRRAIGCRRAVLESHGSVGAIGIDHAVQCGARRCHSRGASCDGYRPWKNH